MFGYTFLWLGENAACFISLGGFAIVLSKHGADIPYLYERAYASRIIGDDLEEVDSTLSEAGLLRWHGKRALKFDVVVPYFWPATPASSEGVPAASEVVAPSPIVHEVKRPTRWKSKHEECNVCCL